MEKGSVTNYITSDLNEDQVKEWNLTTQYIILYGTALGIEYLHSKGIEHRDIKPKNILLNEKLYPFICDFGISAIRTNPDSFTEARLGSYPFMAPEVIFRKSGEKYSGKMADIFSFGSTMYSILEKTVPFYGLELRAIPYQFLQNQIPPFSDEINEEIKSLIIECWNLNPKERPTINEIVSRLLKIIPTIPTFDEEAFNAFLAFYKNPMRSKSLTANELNELGFKYRRGDGVEQDFSMAFSCFQESSNQGNLVGLYELGRLYYKGKGVKKDYSKALECFEASSKKGNLDSYVYLGRMHLHGFGVPKDPEMAFTLITRSRKSQYFLRFM